MRYFLSSFILIMLRFEMRKLLLFASIILLTAVSCRQVYWQRNKVRSSGKQLNYSIAVEIKNTVPEIFNTTFNDLLKENCEKAVKKIASFICQSFFGDSILIILITYIKMSVAILVSFAITLLLREMKKENKKCNINIYMK